VSKSDSCANSNINDIFHLAIPAGEASGKTSIIQDKIAIWAAHEPVKNEPAVGFPTPQLVFQHHKKTQVARR
jgi:hypothetical protein